MTFPSSFDIEALLRFLGLNEGEQIEVCAFDQIGKPKRVCYLSSAAEMEQAIAAVGDTETVSGCYLVPNPVGRNHDNNRPIQWARLAGRLRDSQVEERRVIYVDVDSIRSKRANATSTEVRSAEWLAEQVREELEYTIPSASIAMGCSGNGAFLLIAIEPTKNTKELTQKLSDLLETLGKRFDNDQAKVDKSVGNAARLVPLPGTTKRKGPHSEERPHRLVTLKLPALVERTSVELLVGEKDSVLAKLLKELGRESQPLLPRRTASGNGWLEGFDAAALLERLRIPNRTGRATCPGCNSVDALIGDAGLTCFHDRCAHRGSKAGAGGAFLSWVEVVSLVHQVSRTEAQAWLVENGPRKAQTGDEGDAGDGEIRGSRVRVRVVVTPDEARMVDKAIEALGNWGCLFNRSGVLVEVVPDGSFRTVSATRLRDELTRHAEFWAVKEGAAPRRVTVPDVLAKQVLERPGWPGIRELTQVLNHPFLHQNGPVEDNGYHAPSHTLVVLDSTYPRAPLPADKAAAELALKRLIEPFGEFPFSSDASLSATAALILTLLLRPSISGPVPLFLIDATIAGSGKTLLAKAIGLAVVGRVPPVSVFPKNAEELRKRISAELLLGSRLVIFDNLDARLGGDSLDAVVTSRSWSDRRLGETALIQIPNTAVFVATGNNVALGNDTIRRTVLIRLEPECEAPDQRANFKHQDLLKHVQTIRPQMVVDALTILLAYIQAGSPDMNLRPLGSFEGWSASVRSALVWTGATDPLQGADDFRTLQSDQRQAEGDVLRYWQKLFGEDPVTASHAAKQMDWEPDSPLGALLRKDGPRNATQLSRVIRPLRGKIIDGLKLESLSRTKHGVEWVVRSVTSSSTTPKGDPKA